MDTVDITKVNSERAEAVRNMLLATHDDYKNTFETEAGKRVVEDLEKLCYYSISTVNMKSINVDEMVFREGMRAVLLRIKNYSNSNNFKKFVEPKNAG